MRWFILDRVQEVWVTDAQGVAYQADILDFEGMSLLTGAIVPIDPPVVINPLPASISREIGSDPVILPLRAYFAGDDLEFSWLPESMATINASDEVVIEVTQSYGPSPFIIRASNSSGMRELVTELTFTSPVVVDPDPVDPDPPAVSGPVMTARAGTEGFGAAGHSSLMEAFDGGRFDSDHWDGPVYLNVIGGTTHTSVLWAANGAERNNPVSLLMISEMDEADGRYAAPGTAQAQTNLQHQYWYGLTAAAQGADLILFWHTTRQADWEARWQDNRALINFYRQWLSDKLGRTVYVLPVDLYVSILRETMSAAEIWQDNFHLQSAPRSGVGYMLARMTKGTVPPILGGEEVFHQAAMRALAEYRWGGTGGAGNDQIIVADDPLPSPAPLPAVTPPPDPDPDPEPEPEPAVGLTWTAADYSGPALTGNQPVVTGQVMRFDGTGLTTTSFPVTAGAYICCVFRFPTAPTGQMPFIFVNPDAVSIFADPYFGLELADANMNFSQWNGSGGGYPVGATPVGEWGIFELWTFGGRQMARLNGVVTGDSAWEGVEQASNGLSLFAVQHTVDVLFVRVSPVLPSEAERASQLADLQAMVAANPSGA